MDELARPPKTRSVPLSKKYSWGLPTLFPCGRSKRESSETVIALHYSPVLLILLSYCGAQFASGYPQRSVRLRTLRFARGSQLLRFARGNRLRFVEKFWLRATNDREQNFLFASDLSWSRRCNMEKTDIAKVRNGSLSSHTNARAPALISAAMRARQSERIKEIRQALIDAGADSLEKQAAVLGLSRSSTWAILQGNHKSSGLRASVISRMLASSQLPPTVRVIIENYVDEKLRGNYGHSKRQCDLFSLRLQKDLQPPLRASRTDCKA
jgi:hypothetical protein